MAVVEDMGPTIRANLGIWIILKPFFHVGSPFSMEISTKENKIDEKKSLGAGGIRTRDPL